MKNKAKKYFLYPTVFIVVLLGIHGCMHGYRLAGKSAEFDFNEIKLYHRTWICFFSYVSSTDSFNIEIENRNLEEGIKFCVGLNTSGRAVAASKYHDVAYEFWELKRAFKALQITDELKLKVVVSWRDVWVGKGVGLTPDEFKRRLRSYFNSLNGQEVTYEELRARGLIN